MDNKDICKKMCTHLGQRDIPGLCQYLAEDIVIEYPAAPQATIKGKQQLTEVLQGFFGWATDGKATVLRSVSQDNTVWLECLDSWYIENTWVDVPIVSIFELKDQLIVRWTEYLDFGYMNQFKSRPGDTSRS